MQKYLPILGFVFFAACDQKYEETEMPAIEPTSPSTYCDGNDLVIESGVIVNPDGTATSSQSIEINSPQCLDLQ